MKEGAKERMWQKLQSGKGRNLRECSSTVLSVSRWLMSEVRGSSWHQKLRGWQNVWPRQRPGWTWNVTEASNMARLELKNLLAQRFLQPRATVRQADCWLLEFYFSPKIRRRSVATKKSLIKGSGSLWQRLQETCFVSKCLHSTGCCKLIFWTVQTLPEHHFVRTAIHIQFHTKSRYSTTHKAQSPTEHIKSDWMIWRRQNEEHIWIFLGSELH